MGGQSGQPSLQQVDYRYNIRGWLTDINDTGQLQKTGKPIDLFAFKINYNEDLPSYFPGNSGVEPLYNGNISETYWRTASDNTLRGYGYNYDELNRLKNAYYQKPNAVVKLPQTFDEYLAYDLNGNITALQRYSGDDSPGSTQLTDDLNYTYDNNSNQLKSVSDSTGSSIGFDDGNTNPALDDYEYDQNGNMVKDRNKGIENITYNHLNLPVEIKWTNNKKINYLYTATGVKVQKKVTNGTNIRTTDYLDGFQYNQQVLEFFPHAEGYVKATPTGLVPPGTPPSAYAFNYVFNYTDHLGNVRVSYTKDPQTGNLKILDESHYYPFGLKHQEYQASSFTTNPIQGVIIAPVVNNPFKHKYNGKEWQDELGLNMYDYGWRNYDPAIGRWMNVDPLAELYKFDSPYVYVNNNPIYFVDVKGMYKMPKKDQQAYSVLANYLKNGISEILNDKAIMDGLKKYGGFTESQIKEQIIKWDSGILIEIREEMPLNSNGTYGGGMGGRNQSIQINKVMADRLQNATNEDREVALLAIMLTILHESVHYGDETYSDGVSKQLSGVEWDFKTKEGDGVWSEKEVGKAFIIDVFWDGDVDSFNKFQVDVGLNDRNISAASEILKRRKKASEKDISGMSIDVQDIISDILNVNPNVNIYVTE